MKKTMVIPVVIALGLTVAGCDEKADDAVTKTGSNSTSSSSTPQPTAPETSQMVEAVVPDKPEKMERTTGSYPLNTKGGKVSYGSAYLGSDLYLEVGKGYKALLATNVFANSGLVDPNNRSAYWYWKNDDTDESLLVRRMPLELTGVDQDSKVIEKTNSGVWYDTTYVGEDKVANGANFVFLPSDKSKAAVNVYAGGKKMENYNDAESDRRFASFKLKDQKDSGTYKYRYVGISTTDDMDIVYDPSVWKDTPGETVDWVTLTSDKTTVNLYRVFDDYVMEARTLANKVAPHAYSKIERNTYLTSNYIHAVKDGDTYIVGILSEDGTMGLVASFTEGKLKDLEEAVVIFENFILNAEDTGRSLVERDS